MKYTLGFHGKIILTSSLSLLIIGVITLYYSKTGLLTAHFEGAGLGLLLMILMWRVFRGSLFNLRGLIYPAMVMGFILFLGMIYSSSGLKIAVLERVWGWENYVHLIEFAKITLLIGSAHFLAGALEQPSKKSRYFMALAAIILPVLYLTIKQTDAGSVLLITTLCFIMLFLARAPFIYIGSLMLATLSAGLYGFTHTHGIEEKISIFLDPWGYSAGDGAQTVRSLISLGSGGLLGANESLKNLPQAHSGYIFALIGQIWGMMGVGAVLILFILFIWAGLKIALRQRDLFSGYLAAGFTCLIGMQGLFNIFMVLGISPGKGLALPFISYGRTALIANLGGVGIMLAFASKKLPKKISEFMPEANINTSAVLKSR